MAINDYDSDEHWIDTKLVGDARDDFPTVYPLKENVRAIVQVAKDRQGQEAFDRTLAREMNGLSMKEREHRFEEMHGVSSFIDETPAFVAKALWELDQELASIPLKSAYNLAYSMDRSYVENTRFRLMFLRADLFDARKAAERLVLFFEKKLRFYGPATLVRSILMSDLCDDDITTLKSGVFQILPSRDRSGRPILFLCSNCGPKLYTSPLSFLRCWWYSVIAAFEEDEENQKRGAVVIVWWMDYLRREPDLTPEVRKEVFGAIRWLPIRPYNSMHICVDDSISKHLLARVQIALSPPEIRYNYKIHAGGLTEVLYHLMSFGIPVDAIPVSVSGTIKTKDFLKWIVRRKKKEDYMVYRGKNSTWDRVDLPNLNDVLFAKGRPYQHHPGNQEYLRLIQDCLIEYDSASNRKDKRAIACNLIDSMRMQSTRFLIKDSDDWWVEASDKDLHEKVIKAFSHASATLKKRSSVSTSIKYNESPMGKRLRIEPRIGMDVTNEVPCLTQSCFLLEHRKSHSLRA